MIHHLSAATMCPHVPAALMGGHGSFVCHCLLVESSDGLIAIDTGLGLGDHRRPFERLGRGFTWGLGLRADEDQSLLRQVERMGFRASDVRHIVPTHLDLDHVGGLVDFPDAQVHVFKPEYEAAMHPSTFLERERYRASMWAHEPAWKVHLQAGERWMGFESVRPIEGLDVDILLVPLVGHTRGHCAVAVKAPTGWLLHCGDAYFHRSEVNADAPAMPSLVSFFERVVQTDRKARLYNQGRLRDLRRDRPDEVRLFCAHDPTDFAEFSTGA